MSAAIIMRLMRDNEHLRDENGRLRIENEELRALAFGEIEHFEGLAARWSRHLQPRRGHAGIPVIHAPLTEDQR